MSTRYDAADIEVLTGLEPVRKRPGMYTDTSRPNHLVQEVVDNSVDEALAGHCRQIDVVLHADGAVLVAGTPEQFGEFIRRETARWAGIIKAANITGQ